MLFLPILLTLIPLCCISPQALLKILKHSTDSSPPIAPSAPSARDAYNPTRSNDPTFQPDAIGLLIGLDLKGTVEVVDAWGLPVGAGGAASSGDGEKFGGEYRAAVVH